MIQSIERAFTILETVAANSEGIGVTEIAQQVRLPKSTVSRLITTLEAIEIVEREEDGDAFSIGPGLIALAAQAPTSRHLQTAARSFLLELAEATGETVNLGVPDGDQILFVDQVNSQYHIQIQDWTGYRFPLHVTSGGKLFLAHRSKKRRDAYLTRSLQEFTEDTITDPAELRQELMDIRQQGYAWARGESEEKMVGLGVPIWDADNKLIAAVSVGGPAFRFPPEGQVDETVNLVREIGQKITASLRPVA